MIYKDRDELLDVGYFKLIDDGIEITDLEQFKKTVIDNLVDTLILSNSIEFKKFCHWVIYEAAQIYDVTPSSINNLYQAIAKEELPSFTVPALNLRTLTYDMAKAAFRSALKINAAALIFEIAKSEISYTSQSPREYISCILAAAIKTGFTGAVFLQGDHFQVDISDFEKDQENEIEEIKSLIAEAVENGFYNIDIDSSTLVNLSAPDIKGQQKRNYETSALLTKFIRSIQPKGIEISVGGEIGELGNYNSTPEELRSFLTGYFSCIENHAPLTKITVQTGTIRGGVLLPDGSMAKVNIDFDTLKNLSVIAREEFGLAGAVQYGASTLPNDAFNHFPQAQCTEIHLATQFQNMVYDYMPLSLKEKIYQWLYDNCESERLSDQTKDQFIYKTRKKALGNFKRDIYSLSRDLKSTICSALEEEFTFLFDRLNIKDTKKLVEKYIPIVKVKKSLSQFCDGTDEE